MARKNGIRNDSTITFDTRTKTVMADVVQENIKEKVNSVREVVSGKSNNEIVLVLQYYDYDVEKTIQAYLEGGAKEALQQWQFSGNKPVKKKRNKKKNVNNNQASDAPRSPESISSESGSARSFMVNGEISQKPVMNGILNHDINHTTKVVANGPTASTTYQQVPKPSSTVPNSSTTTTSSPPSSSSTLPLDTSQKPPSTKGVKVTSSETGAKEKSPSPQSQKQHHSLNHSNRQRTHSGSHGHEGRDRTASTSSVDSKSGKKPAHLGLERSAKDLHRQTVSLERLKLIFKEEIEKSHKRIKSVFDEIRARLDAREKLLMGQLDELKHSGDDVLSMRQGLASDLKIQIDRAERMNEDDLANLRVDIKHFVCDRKIDEDLAKTIRFMYDDQLTNDIYAFGEIVPLKCQYVQQRSNTVTSSVDTDVNYKETNHISKPVVDNTSSNDSHKKLPVSHLDPTQTEELAKLQRRLKHSLTLEGIPVETFPDRPASVPATSTNNVTNYDNNKPRPESARRGSGRGRPRNDRPRQDGPKPDNRGSFNQAPGGERVILIGRKTGPQASGRGSRGGRGRGRGRVYYGRGRGQNYNNSDDNSNSIGAQRNNPTSSGDSRDQGASPSKPQSRDQSMSPSKPQSRDQGASPSQPQSRDQNMSPGKPQSHDQSMSPGKPQRENSNRRGSGRGSGYGGRGRGNSSPGGSGSNTNRSSSNVSEKKEG